MGEGVEKKVLHLYLLGYHFGQHGGEELKLLYAETEEEARAEALKVQERERERGNWLTPQYVQHRPRGFVIRSRRYPRQLSQ